MSFLGHIYLYKLLIPFHYGKNSTFSDFRKNYTTYVVCASFHGVKFHSIFFHYLVLFQRDRENNGFQIIFNSAQLIKINFVIFILLKGFILKKLGVLEFFGLTIQKIF